MKNPIDLAAQAAAFADKYNMLPQGSTVLCALSGGADSMALLSVLEALAKPRSLTLHAAHFNHQLRGEESQRDEDFVVQWCQKRGIPLVVGRGDVAQEAQEQGKGVEETARAMRYGFLTATAQELGADKIATAHNADDNAETLLLHLAVPCWPPPASTSPSIWPRKKFPMWRTAPTKTPSMPATVCGRR